MNQKERMLNNLPYKAWLDGLKEERDYCHEKIYEYNNLNPSNIKVREELLKELLGSTKNNFTIEQPFHCDYGKNIYLGENFYANFNLVILDVGKVIIGENVMCGPNVSIYTAGHPIHPISRNSGYEYGIEITIGDNVWIGGNAIINPGVHIGSNSVIGSGSVVTKDVPDWSVVAGNPAKIIKKITENDREYFFNKQKFDVKDY